MKRSKSGEQLWKDMRVRVVIPGQKDNVQYARAAAGRGWSRNDLDGMLERFADDLEKRYPSIEFRMVELQPNRFNFIYEGRKELAQAPKNPCPDAAVASAIAEKVCAVHGHSIASYSNGVRVTQQGMMPEQITVCSKCGLGLNEIREGTDRAFNAAVAEAVKQAVAAIAPPPVPGAGGPFPVPDAKQVEQPA